jgi:cobalt-precorrin 5A hydrolase/precorrin-3B C17-methyltransferase
MAAAVLEALDASGDSAWAAVELSIVPGVSAAMATAAQAGAPLGHDFCMLSLSDNLKPWSIIEKRLRHAAQADLVMAFYNPISRARPWQLDKALDIVREYRAANTQVVLGRDIGRPGATLRTVTLGELRSADVDMRTMLIVGSSTTRRFTRGAQWVYTPRRYE